MVSGVCTWKTWIHKPVFLNNLLILARFITLYFSSVVLIVVDTSVVCVTSLSSSITLIYPSRWAIANGVCPFLSQIQTISFVIKWVANRMAYVISNIWRCTMFEKQFYNEDMTLLSRAVKWRESVLFSIKKEFINKRYIKYIRGSSRRNETRLTSNNNKQDPTIHIEFIFNKALIWFDWKKYNKRTHGIISTHKKHTNNLLSEIFKYSWVNRNRLRSFGGV